MTNGDPVVPPVERIPFGQDFTPATLGKRLGEDSVLGWLLEAAASGTRTAFAAKVAAECLSHVPGDKDRRDMASHVVTAMRGYRLIAVGEADEMALLPMGQLLREAPGNERDVLFARHILSSCQGQRLVDAIKRYELRGEVPDMEDLSIELGEAATSKNISTLRAWLARAGAVSAKGAYRVIDEGLERLLGPGVAALYGLNETELEFLLAARLAQSQGSAGSLDAVVVADLAEARNPDIRIRRKSLDRFVKTLEAGGHVRLLTALAGKGGSRTAFELLTGAINVTEEQLRELLAQSDTGLSLAELLPLREVVAGLGEGTAEKIGRMGEQLAVHLCLMLGLRVRSWRKRAPHSEIDLIAERLSGLTYQRWVVQVKNTDGNLDGDQVDREIGATAGLGVTHILFVVPRAGATQPALGEIRMRSRLTHLHIYLLTGAMLVEKRAEHMLVHLRRQARQLEADKRDESERREGRPG
ncbi:MAG TPA: restriction endonuclease [Polyangiaceae bacterium]|nr:restriction endonuclease [Polyangiaceae bacterium]